MSGSKHKSSSDVASTAKKHQVIKMETKVNVIERVKWGQKIIDKIVDIAQSYNMNSSTFSMILKNKDKIMEHMQAAVLMILTRISK